jgi:hypothetical protein
LGQKVPVRLLPDEDEDEPLHLKIQGQLNIGATRDQCERRLLTTVTRLLPPFSLRSGLLQTTKLLITASTTANKINPLAILDWIISRRRMN